MAQHCTLDHADANGPPIFTDTITSNITIFAPKVGVAVNREAIVGSDTRVNGTEDEATVALATPAPCFCLVLIRVVSDDPENPTPLRFPFLSISGDTFWLARNSFSVPQNAISFRLRGNTVTRPTIAHLRAFYPDAPFGSPPTFVAETTITVLPKAPAQLGARYVTPSRAEDVIETSDPNSHIATFVLGSEFAIRLLKKDIDGVTLVPIPVDFTLGPSFVNAGVNATSLYQGTAAALENTSSSTELHFLGVHTGNLQVQLTPADHSGPAVSVLLVIVEPNSLGSTHSEVDRIISRNAHANGIPPQYIKAQMEGESNFRQDTSWRYEPLTVDFGYGISVGNPPSIANTYSSFALGATRATSSASLVDADIAPRGQGPYALQVRDAQTRALRTIQLNDANPTARALVDINDAVQNWTAPGNASAHLRDLYAQHPERFEFVAQTPVASSWGLMHVLYPTARGMLHDLGLPEDRNPSFLLDDVTDVERLSSVPLGARYLGTRFATANAGFAGDETLDELSVMMVRAFNLYNHNCLGTRRDPTRDVCSTDPYGVNAGTRVPKYVPVAGPTTPIFDRSTQ